MKTLPKPAIQLARGIATCSEWIGRLTYWFVLLMVGVGVWNVIGRYIGRAIGQNLTSNALIEIQWYCFDLVFFLGAAYTLKHDAHVRVDVFYKGFSRRQKAWVNLLGTLLFLIPFSALVIYFSWGSIVNSWTIWELSPDPGGLPRAPIKSLIVVSFVLLIGQGIAEALKNLAILLEGEES
ncbi:MAG: TRAP transporter small permease subunit [Spirulinaceae cyanobacterium]